DEGEILVGERQDRDLGEIDLLVARQRQQQVERAFEALDVDHQRRLVGGTLGEFGFELEVVRAHDTALLAPAVPASMAAKVRRASTVSMAAGARRAASAASARRAASSASGGDSAA